MDTSSEERCFEQITLEVDLVVDGNTKPRTGLTLDRRNLPSRIDEVLGDTKRATGADQVCVIGGNRCADNTFTKREHFVLEGLGFTWTKFRKGVGSCDACNRAFGDQDEREWLRHGLMGTYRPHHVGKTKRGKVPRFIVGTDEERALEFTRNEAGVRELVVGPDVDLRVIEAEGGGVVEVRVPDASDARPVAVSRTLHKMALLNLWLAAGPLVFIRSFDPLREFLHETTDRNFRPYWESLGPDASPPGFKANYQIAGTTNDKGQLVVRHVDVVMRIHHAVYGLQLVGQLYEALPDGLRWREWEDPSIVPRSPLTLAWGVRGLQRFPTEHDRELPD